MKSTCHPQQASISFYFGQFSLTASNYSFSQLSRKQTYKTNKVKNAKRALAREHITGKMKSQIHSANEESLRGVICPLVQLNSWE